jgi:hypothetical protein
VTISARLESHKYHTAADWCRSIDLVFDNTERYYQEGPILVLGQEIYSTFKKAYKKEFQVRTTADWCREMVRLRDKLGRLNSLPPQIPVCEITFGQKLSSQIPTDKEIRTFLTSMAKMTKPEDHEELLAMLKKEEPEMSFGEGKVQVDLVLLKPSTIRLATAFVEQKLAGQPGN